MIGMGKDVLISTLEDFSELTGSESVIKPNKLINISVEKSNNGIRGFVVSHECYGKNKPIILAKGSGLKSLKKVIDNEDKVNEPIISDNGFSVIICNDIETEKKTGNLIASHWYKVPIGGFLDAEDGSIEFETVSFLLDEDEHKILSETNIALWNERTEVAYPITEDSKRSIIRFVDGCSIFKNTSYFPLAQGFVLAKAFEQHNKTEIRFKNVYDNIKPIISVGPYKKGRIEIKPFIMGVIDNLEKKSELCIKKWEVTDVKSIVHCELNSNDVIKNAVDIIYENDKRMNPRIVLKNEYNEVGFFVDKRSHIRNEDVASITNGVIDVLNENAAFIKNSLYKNINFEENSELDNCINNIYSKLGKARTESIDSLAYGTYRVKDILDFITETHKKFRFTEDTKNRLENDYGKLIQIIKEAI